MKILTICSLLPNPYNVIFFPTFWKVFTQLLTDCSRWPCLSSSIKKEKKHTKKHLQIMTCQYEVFPDFEGVWYISGSNSKFVFTIHWYNHAVPNIYVRIQNLTCLVANHKRTNASLVLMILEHLWTLRVNLSFIVKLCNDSSRMWNKIIMIIKSINSMKTGLKWHECDDVSFRWTTFLINSTFMYM